MGSRKWYKTISVLFALVFVFIAVWAAGASPTAMAGENKKAREVTEHRHNPEISTANSVSRALRFSALGAEEPVERHVDAGWSEGNCEDYEWGETAFNTIQDAVDAASPGDTICVHEGTYEENVIVDKEDLTIEGDNEPTVSTDTLGGHAFFLTVPGVTIRGFNIEADGSGIYFDYYMDEEYGATSGAVIDNHISAGKEGLYINKITGDLEITDNYISSNFNDGIYIDVTVDASLDISGNEIRDCGYCGIYFYSMNYTDLSFNDNTVEGNDNNGFYIYNMGSDEDFSEDNYSDVDYHNKNTAEVTGNSISGNGNCGLYFEYIDFDAEVAIEDNSITDNGDGICLEYVGQQGGPFWHNSDFAAPRIYVRENILNDNGESGICHYDDWQYGTEVIIEDNDISGNGYYGIDQYYSLQFDSVLIVRNNQINNNAYGGIVWDYPIETGASYYVINNVITGNGNGESHGGIYLYEVYDTAGNVEIGPNNIISDNLGPGVELYDVTGVRIWGNIIEGNFVGVFVEDSYDNEVVGNQILDNNSDTSGIHCDSDDGQHNANYNDLIENGYAVYSDNWEPFDASLNWWGSPDGPNAEDADDTEGDVITSPWVTSAYFQQGTVSLRRGRTSNLVLKADTMDSDGNPGTITVPPKTVALVSSDPDTVMVDVDGSIKALRRGTATVTALFANKPSVTVKVEERGSKGRRVDRDDDDKDEDADEEQGSGDGSDEPNASEESEVIVIKLTLGQNTALVNEETVQLDAVPYIKAANGRTYVPIRFVSEILGAKVAWNPQTQRVIITDNGKGILLTIGSGLVVVDGVVSSIDSAPEIVAGRTFVGLRFISEALGAEVAYDAATGQITITK